jgi:hypothetical protein
MSAFDMAQSRKKIERMTMWPNTALEATPHSRRGFASELCGCFESLVRGASAFVR